MMLDTFPSPEPRTREREHSGSEGGEHVAKTRKTRHQMPRDLDQATPTTKADRRRPR